MFTWLRNAGQTAGIIPSPALTSVHLRSGTLAANLGPRLEQILKGQSTIIVVERTVDALTTSAQKEWRSFLRTQLAAGSRIHYIFTDAYAHDKRAFDDTAATLAHNTTGTLSACYFTQAVANSDRDVALQRSFRTYHPVLAIEETGKRVMWIEEYHPPECVDLAYSVEFVAPEDAALDIRFEKLQGMLESIMARYAIEAAVPNA